MRLPGVLMVTGAYYPDVSGGGLQCRTLAATLRARARIFVLTTSRNALAAAVDEVDGVPVYRIPVDVGSIGSRVKALLRMAQVFFRLRREIDIVHLHGFSRKSLLLVVLAVWFRKKVVVKLTLLGEDDPAAIRARGRLAYRCYTRADLFIGISQRQQEVFAASGLPRERFRLIPNGVDLERFRPADATERSRLRAALGLPEASPLVLFVGMCLRRKHPELLLEAWLRLRREGLPGSLVFVGTMPSPTYEAEPGLFDALQASVAAHGAGSQVRFIEQTAEAEQFYRAADVFALPSDVEGFPNVLLEAMAAGLPCIASRLPGVLDAVVTDGLNGLLVEPGNLGALQEALRSVCSAPDRAAALGRRARETVAGQYGIDRTASRVLAAYHDLLDLPRPRSEAAVQEMEEACAG